MINLIQNYVDIFKELWYLAYHDPLTGILNRNWILKYSNTIKKRYVYFIDINNLSLANADGHMYGDAHIVNIVESIKNIITVNDIFIRYGGDEFLLFSDVENLLTTNSEYSVGYCEIINNVTDAINLADYEMIKSKFIYKLKT